MAKKKTPNLQVLSTTDHIREKGFELGPENEAALLESIQEADAGKLIDGNEVLRELGCGN